MDIFKRTKDQLQDCIDFRKERISFWVKFADSTSNKALSIQRHKVANLHKEKQLDLEEERSR